MPRAHRGWDHHLKSGTKLGPYLLHSSLGQGGFGITYRATDTEKNIEVAIKEYYPRSFVNRAADEHTVYAMPDDREAFTNGKGEFLGEANMLKMLNHRYIVSVIDAFTANGTVYMVMPFYEGSETLKDWLVRTRARVEDRDKPLLEFSSAYQRLRSIFKVLSYLHEKNIIHRDIKPSNILLVPREDKPRSRRVILIDFGGARQFVAEKSGSYSRLLTPGYSPVEQYNKRARLGAWTDVYALAATLLTVILGRTPPEALDRLAAQQEGQDEIAWDRLENHIQPIMQKALAVDYRNRYQSVKEFEDAIRKAIRSAPKILKPHPTDDPSETSADVFQTNIDESADRSDSSIDEPDEPILIVDPPEKPKRKHSVAWGIVLSIFIFLGATAMLMYLISL